jgi:hypothetical protein
MVPPTRDRERGTAAQGHRSLRRALMARLTPCTALIARIAAWSGYPVISEALPSRSNRRMRPASVSADATSGVLSL